MANVTYAQESLLKFTPTGESTASVAATSRDISGVVTVPSKTIINGKEYTVTSVAEWGFDFCYQLEEIVLPEGIWEIAIGAFYHSGIKCITIPASTTLIRQEAFRGCSNLQTIQVSEGNPYYYVSNGILMGNSERYVYTSIIVVPPLLNIEDYNIPEDVGQICDYAFMSNKNLKSIIIPSSVKSVYSFAFCECEELQEVEWQSSSSISNGCFWRCSSLHSIVIHESVKNIEESAFGSCFYIRSITIRNGSPIGIENSSFTDEVYENAILFVPRGSAKYYRSAAVWKKFKHIEEIDMPGIEVPENHYAALEDNQMILGYYRSENCQSPYDEYGGMDVGTQYAYIGFDKEWMTPLKNNYIRNIRFAMKDTALVYDMKVFIGSEQLKDDICLQEVKSPKIGWNEVELQKPYLITGDSIFVGVQFKLREYRDYPLEWVYGGEEGSFYRYGTVGGEFGQKPYQYWDWGKDRGYALCVQCLVDGYHLPENVVHYSSLSIDQKYVKLGETLTGSLSIRNTGNNPINNVTLSAHISEKEFPISISEYTFQNTLDDNSEMKDLSFQIPLNSTLELGKNEITVDVQTINGNTFLYDGGNHHQQLFRFYTQSMKRDKILVEFFSSQGCGNTYWGYEMVNAMKHKYPETACVMYYRGAPEDICENYIDALITDFPTVYVSRYGSPGARKLNGGYVLAVEEAMVRPAFANVNIESQYDESSRKLQVKVSGMRNAEFIPVEDYTYLTIHLVEDDLVIVNDWSGETEIQDDILRGCMTDIWGDLVEWNGDTYEMNYSMKLPASWNPEKMRIIAFLAKPFKGNNFDEMDVVNCNEAKVGGNSTSSIGESIVDIQHGNREGIYNLNGQFIGSDVWRNQPKGIYIVNGKKYVKKQQNNQIKNLK